MTTILIFFSSSFCRHLFFFVAATWMNEPTNQPLKKNKSRKRVDWLIVVGHFSCFFIKCILMKRQQPRIFNLFLVENHTAWVKTFYCFWCDLKAYFLMTNLKSQQLDCFIFLCTNFASVESPDICVNGLPISASVTNIRQWHQFKQNTKIYHSNAIGLVNMLSDFNNWTRRVIAIYEVNFEERKKKLDSVLLAILCYFSRSDDVYYFHSVHRIFFYSTKSYFINITGLLSTLH